jgi:hypothetical protein
MSRHLASGPLAGRHSWFYGHDMTDMSIKLGYMTCKHGDRPKKNIYEYLGFSSETWGYLYDIYSNISSKHDDSTRTAVDFTGTWNNILYNPTATHTWPAQPVKPAPPQPGPLGSAHGDLRGFKGVRQWFNLGSSERSFPSQLHTIHKMVV